MSASIDTDHPPTAYVFIWDEYKTGLTLSPSKLKMVHRTAVHSLPRMDDDLTTAAKDATASLRAELAESGRPATQEQWRKFLAKEAAGRRNALSRLTLHTIERNGAGIIESTAAPNSAELELLNGVMQDLRGRGIRVEESRLGREDLEAVFASPAEMLVTRGGEIDERWPRAGRLRGILGVLPDLAIAHGVHVDHRVLNALTVTGPLELVRRRGRRLLEEQPLAGTEFEVTIGVGDPAELVGASPTSARGAAIWGFGGDLFEVIDEAHSVSTSGRVSVRRTTQVRRLTQSSGFRVVQTHPYEDVSGHTVGGVLTLKTPAPSERQRLVAAAVRRLLGMPPGEDLPLIWPRENDSR